MSSPQSNRRIAAMSAWLKTLGLNIENLNPVTGDASFRRYFRLSHANASYIVMDAPPERENTPAFVHVATLFKTATVHVPEIYHQNMQEGFLVLEDLGNTSLLDSLTEENVDFLYAAACDNLFRLQTQIDLPASRLPVYDEALLQRELDIFYQWFLTDWQNAPMPLQLQSSLNRLLIDSALEQPKVCVHRDFHSRNLMLSAQLDLSVIDFQDAVIGPVTYDLVSLLRDCYIAWPQQRVDTWLQHYHQRLLMAKLVDCDQPAFRRWFDLMGLQRHLKAIGIFTRLHLRDNKSQYLNDIPRTMSYIVNVCRTYPELESFYRFLEQHRLISFNHA